MPISPVSLSTSLRSLHLCPGVTGTALFLCSYFRPPMAKPIWILRVIHRQSLSVLYLTALSCVLFVSPLWAVVLVGTIEHIYLVGGVGRVELNVEIVEKDM